MAHYLCPFCNQHQAITAPKRHHEGHKFYIEGNAEGQIGAAFTVLSCSNPQCLKSTVHLTIGTVVSIGHGRVQLDTSKRVLMKGRIIPMGAAKEYPNFIPAPLLEDYREACLRYAQKLVTALIRRRFEVA